MVVLDDFIKYSVGSSSSSIEVDHESLMYNLFSCLANHFPRQMEIYCTCFSYGMNSKPKTFSVLLASSLNLIVCQWNSLRQCPIYQLPWKVFLNNVGGLIPAYALKSVALCDVI